MFDILPYPNVMGETAEDKISSLYNYLLQLKENLEFILSNIGTDNLSADLIKRLESIGADISVQEKNTEDYLQQIAQRTISVRDVIESDMFAYEMEKLKESIKEEMTTITVRDILDSDEFTTYMNNFKEEIKREIIGE